MPKQTTRFSHDPEVGVTWICNLGFEASHWFTSGWLWAARLSITSVRGPRGPRMLPVVPIDSSQIRGTGCATFTLPQIRPKSSETTRDGYESLSEMAVATRLTAGSSAVAPNNSGRFLATARRSFEVPQGFRVPAALAPSDVTQLGGRERRSVLPHPPG